MTIVSFASHNRTSFMVSDGQPSHKCDTLLLINLGSLHDYILLPFCHTSYRTLIFPTLLSTSSPAFGHRLSDVVAADDLVDALVEVHSRL